MTTGEAVTALRVSRTTARRMLRAVRVRAAPRVRRADVLGLLAGRPAT